MEGACGVGELVSVGYRALGNVATGINGSYAHLSIGDALMCATQVLQKSSFSAPAWPPSHCKAININRLCRIVLAWQGFIPPTCVMARGGHRHYYHSMVSWTATLCLFKKLRVVQRSYTSMRHAHPAATVTLAVGLAAVSMTFGVPDTRLLLCNILYATLQSSLLSPLNIPLSNCFCEPTTGQYGKY